jgi:hypothetical protein
MSITNAIDKLDAMMKKRIALIAPFRATVTGLSAGMVTIQRLDAATADNQLYARLAGFTLAVNDEVFCLNLFGQPFVVGKLQRAAPTLYTLDAGLTFTGTAPTVTAAAGAGTTGAITGTNGFDSNYGFTVTPGGTGIAAGALATVLFGTARTDGNYNVLFTRRTANSGPLQFYLSSRTTSGFTINLVSAPTTGVAYAIGFTILGFS